MSDKFSFSNEFVIKDAITIKINPGDLLCVRISGNMDRMNKDEFILLKKYFEKEFGCEVLIMAENIDIFKIDREGEE